MIRSLFVSLKCIALLCLFSPINAQADPFRFVVLPDTQIYSWALQREDAPYPDDAYTVTNPEGSFPYFMDQTEWIVNNADAMGIKHVIHLGDIVQNPDQIPEWERAKSAMNILDQGGISYGIAVGGHDIDGEDFTNYLHYFGPQHYEQHEWYGYSPSGTSNFQIIPHDDTAIIFINVALDTPIEEVQWAKSLLNEHKEKLAIISTHKYLWDYRAGNGRYGEKIKKGLLIGQRLFGSDFSPQDFYDELVAQHPNVLMVMAGHVHGSLTRSDGRNGANLPVLEILSDFQDGRNGGDGYLRIYELDIENRQFTAQTYSPSIDRYRTIFEEFVESIKVVSHNLLIDNDIPHILATLGLSRLKADVVPDVNVVTQHPEYQADPEFYDQLLADLYGGEVPPHIGHIGDWEALWMLSYANDRHHPTDYTPNLRAPQFQLEVDFRDYMKGELVKPNPFKKAFQNLLEAINGFTLFFEDLALLIGSLYKN